MVIFHSYVSLPESTFHHFGHFPLACLIDGTQISNEDNADE